MTLVTLEHFSVVVLLPVLTCATDYLLPPKDPTYTWLDPFTVNVRWQERVTQRDCQVQHVFCHHGQKEVETKCRTTIWSNFTTMCLTEQTPGKYDIKTISRNNCGLNDSAPVTVDVEPAETHAPSLKDFKCVVGLQRTNCSWFTENFNLTLKFRICGKPERGNLLKECSGRYSAGGRDGCYLDGEVYLEKVCMQLRTQSGSRTFKPRTVVDPPVLKISEDGGVLTVNLSKPDVLMNCDLMFLLCFTRCDRHQECREISGPFELPYDDRCRYSFWARVTNNTSCIRFQSDFGDVAYFGSNKSPDQTFLVVAVVVPLVLSICVLLSCICLRRHRKIFCPTIPDPSAIFTDFMFPGTGPPKSSPVGGLYVPVPEPVQQCTIAPLPQEPDS